MTIIYRRARSEDGVEAAALLAEAGGDVLQFVLDEIAPGIRARDLLAHMVAGDDTECSHRHCIVAESGGAIVGVANAFPTALLVDAPPESLSPRERHLEPRTALKDPDSYRLNMIAVDPRLRRRGIAAGLLDAVLADARAQGFGRISLHVWADNAAALAFYRAQGFAEAGRAEMPWHPALPHRGGSLLLIRPLAASGAASLRPSLTR